MITYKETNSQHKVIIIHLHTFLSLSATGHHWLATLSTYLLGVLYRPGKNNTDADLLSRNLAEEDNTVLWWVG